MKHSLVGCNLRAATLLFGIWFVDACSSAPDLPPDAQVSSADADIDASDGRDEHLCPAHSAALLDCFKQVEDYCAAQTCFHPVKLSDALLTPSGSCLLGTPSHEFCGDHDGDYDKMVYTPGQSQVSELYYCGHLVLPICTGLPEFPRCSTFEILPCLPDLP